MQTGQDHNGDAKDPMDEQKGTAKNPLQPFWDKLNSKRGRPPRSAPKPLLDIEDVRAFVRSITGPPKPPPRLPDYTPRASSSYFGMGTLGSSSSYPPDAQDGKLSSPARNPNPNPNPNPSAARSDDSGGDEDEDDYDEGPAPLLDMDDVREAVRKVLHMCGRRPPDTSWKNKMPWLEPRPPVLARGLQWPPESFDSEQQRKEYYRQARKRKPFLMGSPPLWSVTAFNLGFLYFLMRNPLGRFYDYLTKF